MIGIQEGSYKASCPDVHLHNLCHHSYMLRNVNSLEKKRELNNKSPELLFISGTILTDKG